MTFESQFRGSRPWEPKLLRTFSSCANWSWVKGLRGRKRTVHPFMCEVRPKRRPLTGADVLKWLRARDFRSRHIESLDATSIPYPGYHPGDVPVKTTTRFTTTYPDSIFPKGDEGGDEDVDECGGTHGVLKRSVAGGRLWYVLLHITPERTAKYLFSNYVILFAVGRSLNGDRLLGVVTHQVCHNLCD